MSNKKFLILIVISYVITVATTLAIIQPNIKDSFDITLELTFIFQPVIWIFLTRRYFKGRLYTKALLVGFICFFVAGVLEIFEDTFPGSAVIDILEDFAMVVAIGIITYAIFHITRVTNKKLLMLSNKNKKHYMDSIHDPMTSLYNKRYLQSNFSMIFNNNPAIFINCVCVFVDIDNFKIFNDTQGHEIGDMILEELGALINESKRKGDFAFRYGGEEFLIFYMNTHPEIIHERLEEVRKKFRAYTKENFYHPEVSFTLSIGTTTYDYGENLSSIISRADSAMYASKHNGKDRITSL